MMSTTTFDTDRSEAFAGRLAETLNGAGLALMTSIGHRTELFDALARLGSATSEELAEEAGLHERYVREWLGAMTVGRVVELDPASERYALPPEHAAWLTRGSEANFGVTAQFVAVLGSVEDAVVERFREGGGVPYERFGRFHQVMAEDSAQTVVAAPGSDPCARPRPRRAAGAGDQSRGSGLRARSRAHRAGPTVSGQQLRRDRPERRRDRLGPRACGRARQRALRGP